MLHELLAAYLERVERSVRESSAAYVEHYVEEILTPERVNLRIRIRFERGHLLEIMTGDPLSDRLREPACYDERRRFSISPS